MTKATIPFFQLFHDGHTKFSPMEAHVGANLDGLDRLIRAGYKFTITLDGNNPFTSPLGYHLGSPTGEELYHGQLHEDLMAMLAEDVTDIHGNMNKIVDGLIKRGVEHLDAINTAEAEALAAQFAHDGKSA